MKLIVGLGNPGKKYSRTRHNIGRRLVETMAASLGTVLRADASLKALVATTAFEGVPLILACPETFMNLSGDSVAAIARYYKIEVEKNLLVVVDDVALPFGKLRLRGQGSDGGHNGLKSVAGILKTKSYGRLRIGIEAARPLDDGTLFSLKVPLEDYVLANFNPSEEGVVQEILQKGIKACKTWIQHPIEQAMNLVNHSV